MYFAKKIMANRDQIIDFCTALLRVDEIPDPYCVNGLQVEGKEEVKKIALGVSSSAAFLQEAANWGADMCLMHHGLLWGKGVQTITGVLKNRLQILMQNDISLAVFHLPLDAHPELGNNAALIEMLALENPQAVECGFVAEYKTAKPFADFVMLVEKQIGNVHLAENFSGKPVQKIGVISGGSASFAPAVAATGADTFLFGEMREHDYHDLKEMKLSFVAAGHFATEREGVQRLGAKVANKFRDIEVRFFDEDCPV